MYIPEAWGYQKARSFTSVGKVGQLWKWIGQLAGGGALEMDRKVGGSFGNGQKSGDIFWIGPESRGQAFKIDKQGEKHRSFGFPSIPLYLLLLKLFCFHA